MQNAEEMENNNNSDRYASEPVNKVTANPVYSSFDWRQLTNLAFLSF